MTKRQPNPTSARRAYFRHALELAELRKEKLLQELKLVELEIDCWHEGINALDVMDAKHDRS